ncbi:hypothetical protein OG389_26540 [Streptomyces sp. NBC_00435]|uniref:hypothetical protein n=1 Tax=Streptomyces sp. NBC_00435 TaxID=2903649 RepID=UPI002E1AF420
MNDHQGYWDPLPAVRASAGAEAPRRGTVIALAPAETYLAPTVRAWWQERARLREWAGHFAATPGSDRP